jgi:beta-lactamase class A
MQKSARPAFFFIILLITFFTGFFVSQLQKNPALTKTINPIRQKGYKFISPLLRFENPPNLADHKLQHLSLDLQNYLEEAKNNNLINEASLYFRLPDTGDWFAIHPEIKYTPASLIKVPIMMAFYHLEENRPNLLSQLLIATPSGTPEPEHYSPLVTLVPNQSYTIDHLIRQMIIESDNTIANLLMAHLELTELNQIFADIHIPPIDFQNSENFLTIGDVAGFFRTLYNASYLNHIHSETALELLSQTEFTKGLVAGIPPGIPVSHKFGERSYPLKAEKQLHDCGLIYLPTKPYVLCIMTRGDSFANLEHVIGRLSQITYQSLSLPD